jgi:uncharacterized membrane protein YgaE (UPF0421/DUF939 family)
MTAEEKARLREKLAQAEDLGIDTFCPDLERYRQKWQRRKDKILAQIAAASSPKEKEGWQQKLVELEQAWKRSDEHLAALRELHGIKD